MCVAGTSQQVALLHFSSIIIIIIIDWHALQRLTKHVICFELFERAK